MSSQQSVDKHTVNDLYQIEDYDKYELVHGELQEVTPTGRRHGKIAANIGTIFQNHVKQTNLGEVGVESGFELTKTTMRAPDISFVKKENIPNNMDDSKYWSIPPDLAVEIVSPSDIHDKIMNKIKDYLNAGTPIVWLIDPVMESVTVYSGENVIETYKSEDKIPEKYAIDGLEVQVDDIFS